MFREGEYGWSVASVTAYANMDYAADLEWANPKLLAKYVEFRSWVDAYKVEHGCVDCGYNAHPAALEFDHLEGSYKDGRVGSMYSWSPIRVLEELAKCELRCSNCHRIKTFERGQHRGHGRPKKPQSGGLT
jgi:hypothetical protein